MEKVGKNNKGKKAKGHFYVKVAMKDRDYRKTNGKGEGTHKRNDITLNSHTG